MAEEWVIWNRGGFTVSDTFPSRERARQSLGRRVKEGAVRENLEIITATEGHGRGWRG